MDKLATDYPAGPNYRNSQAYAHQGRASLLRKLNRPAEAEQAYRRAMDLFERLHGMAPDATLRFKLLPRRPGTDMGRIDLAVVGSSVEFAVPVAPDHSFSLQRNQQAFEEDAQVTPNRRAQSMTWRTDIRTPGLPRNTRRLGDLRLECRVGMEAGLVSRSRTPAGLLVGAVLDTPGYCDKPAPQYLFFSDRPLFSVAMVAAGRREILAIDKLYAAASDNPRLNEELPD